MFATLVALGPLAARARLGDLDDLNRAEAEVVAKISVMESDRIQDFAR